MVIPPQPHGKSPSGRLTPALRGPGAWRSEGTRTGDGMTAAAKARRVGRWVALVTWVAVLAASEVAAQGLDGLESDPFSSLLRRSGRESYRNYAEYEYRPYRTRINQDIRYNFFGDFLADGFMAFRLEEQRPGASVIAKDEAYRSLFNNLVVARTSYGRYNFALTVGDEIRNTLSPMTMQQAGFSGLRWEMEFPNNRVTLLAARGFDRTDFPGYESFSTPVRVEGIVDLSTRRTQIVETNPVYTWGGHWETQVGDVLTLGGTFLNQQQINSDLDGGDGLLKGSAPYADMKPPQVVVLQVTDDSPLDLRGGAAVFEVTVEVEATVAGVDTVFSSDRDSPDYLAGIEPVRSGGRRVGEHWEAIGEEEALLYTVTLPDGMTPRRIRYRIVAANDYRVGVSQTHPFVGGERQTPVFTLHRARGNITDYSNRGMVVLDHGLNSAQTFYGVDFVADLVGLQVRGEVVGNWLHRKFPVRDGHHSVENVWGWYLNAVKSVDGFYGLSLAGELFRLDPRYGGGHNSRRGGLVLYTDKGGTGFESMTAEYPLVEDNDDGDRYADDNANDYPFATALEAGVYPGLDEDNDNIPDDDRNANGIPDYQEAFLLYYSDPQEFVYGLDLNNNGVIDARENDNKPDYPYDRDRKGYHLTATLSPWPGLEVGLGRYRMKTVASSERAVSTYGVAAYELESPRWGRVRLNHDTKRVRDSIPDSVYVFDPTRNITPLDPPDPDVLQQQDSWVFTTYGGTRFHPVRGLTVENNVQFIQNRRHDLDDTPVSEREVRNAFTMVNKVDFEWEWGRFRIHPMYKRLWRRQTLSTRSDPMVSEVQSAPMLRIDYGLTEDLMLQFGQQGVRLGFLGIDRALAFRNVDKVDPFRSYSSTDFLLMLTLKGNYLGNTITTNSGLQLQRRKFDDEDAGKDSRFTRLFVEIVAGFERM